MSLSYDVSGPINNAAHKIAQLQNKLPSAEQTAVDGYLDCPVCQKKMVVYDKMSQKYLCLNNKECSFMNTTLETPIVAGQQSVPLTPAAKPLAAIKSLEDLPGKIVKDFKVEKINKNQKIVIKFEGQDRELHLIPVLTIDDIIVIEAKLIGKKQIITYEDVEEKLD